MVGWTIETMMKLQFYYPQWFQEVILIEDFFFCSENGLHATLKKKLENFLSSPYCRLKPFQVTFSVFLKNSTFNIEITR